MRRHRTEMEQREIAQRTTAIRRFYLAWYRNYPSRKPRKEPLVETDYDKWLARLLRCSGYSSVNNARLGNKPLGRDRIESLHQRLRARLNDDQRGVSLWCLHWIDEKSAKERRNTGRTESIRRVVLRSPNSQIMVIVGSRLRPKSIDIGQITRIRGGGLCIPLTVNYRKSRRAVA